MTRTLGLAIAVGILCAVLLLFGPAACNKIRSLGLQNRVNQEQMDAMGNSAVDAIETQSNVSKAETQASDLTRTNEKEIRDAEGADQAVNPAARDAGLRSLCRRRVYSDSERCRLFNARPE